MIRERIVEVIKSAGLTQMELAAKSGIGQSTISAILTGVRGKDLRVEVVSKLCQACGLSDTATGRLLRESFPLESRSGKTSRKLSGL